ncbi:MAG: CHAT domain-containing protein [Muribaculaceae bacterium]|nr:CHAT domain-containing protein [Muribaculaceae bacterium]
MIIVSLPSSSKGANPVFDRIRPIAAAAADALHEGDSLKALSLFTEALVRGQEWPETSDEHILMSEIIGNIIPLRMMLKNENIQRLTLELMIRPGMEAVYRKDNTFGGRPEKLPSLDASDSILTGDSIAERLRNTIDLMAADKLKECEKTLISLYDLTWKRDQNIEWRHAVANKLGLLYIKLGTTNQAIDILRANKLDMDKKQEINVEYTETLAYLAMALKQDDTKVIWKCYLETANELANLKKLDIQPILDDLARVFPLKEKQPTTGKQIERFIRENDSNLSFLTESQREKRWEKIKSQWSDLKYALLDPTGNVKDIDACLNAFQYEKQIMLRSAAKTMEVLKESGDEEAIALTDSLIRIRQRLAQSLSYNEDSIKAEYERCQKELLHHHVMNGFEDHLYRMLTAEGIADRLDSNETFVDFGTLETDEGDRYYAIFISPNVPHGKIIPLCTSEELDSFMTSTHDEKARRMVEKRYGNEFLFEYLWKPIISEVMPDERIYYCPTGILGLIMPEAISRGGRYLGEDFEFHILSSADDIDNAHAETKYIPYKLFSFCAIDYYCERLALIANAQMYGADKKIILPSLERDSDTRFAFSDPDAIPPLHNPEDFDWLQKLCERHAVPVMVPTGFNASEHALKFLSGRDIGILNIVTHAFSLPKSIGPLDKPYFGVCHAKTRLNENLNSEVFPLYRTGIMLSGAERAWCHRNVISDIEDGIVNGAELAALDLHGVDLLTLMACDTGNGDIDPEEGILGLRRALKLAGCKTIVTTAWNLDKEAGDAYLQEFYTNLLEGSGIQAAHRKAQLELMKRFDNPYYWAVFQLID